MGVTFNPFTGTFDFTGSSGGGGTIAGTIANTQVAFGTAADTIGGSNNLTWDGSTLLVTGLVNATTLQQGGKSLTLSGNLTTTGSFNPTFAIPSSSTWTFPSGGGTLSTTVGTVTSVAQTVPAFLSIAGSPITSSGTLAISLSGTALPVANGGTGATSASITAFNNITGFSAAGTTGTTSTNLVFSTSPTLVTPTLGVATATRLGIGAAADATYPLLVNKGTGSGVAQQWTGTTGNAYLIIGGTGVAYFSTSTDANTGSFGISSAEFDVYLSGGVTQFSVTTASTSAVGTYALAPSAGSSTDLFLRRAGAANLQLGLDLNGAAISQVVNAANGITGTDKTGGNLTIASGKGTGAGAVSSLFFQTPTALGSGSTAQSLTTRLTIDVNGIKATGYLSSDGSAGATGTATAVNTLTVKNGLITNIA